MEMILSRSTIYLWGRQTVHLFAFLGEKIPALVVDDDDDDDIVFVDGALSNTVTQSAK